MKIVIFTVLVLALSLGTAAQDKPSSEMLAEKTFVAHGGNKFKEMKTLVVSGNVDVTASMFNQAIPATFLTVFAGEKYRIEINNPFQPFKQVFDGVETRSSVQRGFTLPPINRLGLPMLQRLGDEGFEVENLEKKKKFGFRIVSSDGYFTDFYVSKKTSRIKAYDSRYIVDGREVMTSVEIDKYEEKDGIVIPKKYAQRFDLGQLTVYAEFKAKEISVNTEVEDDVFTLE